jgi:L-fuculose-phosphate aldolase
MQDIKVIKKQICEVGRRIYEKGMAASNDGNISVRLDNGNFLCTPTSVSKGFMTEEMICMIDADGKVLEAAPGFKPSSETVMHMMIYRNRPDVNAVVHAHPLYATSFAAAGKGLEIPILPEAVIHLGKIYLVEYGTPCTKELSDAVEKYVQLTDALLLENHGALTYGDTLINAYHNMESMEFYAHVLFNTYFLGGPKEIKGENIEKLYEVRRRVFNLKGRHPSDK